MRHQLGVLLSQQLLIGGQQLLLSELVLILVLLLKQVLLLLLPPRAMLILQALHFGEPAGQGCRELYWRPGAGQVKLLHGGTRP